MNIKIKMINKQVAWREMPELFVKSQQTYQEVINGTRVITWSGTKTGPMTVEEAQKLYDSCEKQYAHGTDDDLQRYVDKDDVYEIEDWLGVYDEFCQDIHYLTKWIEEYDCEREEKATGLRYMITSFELQPTEEEFFEKMKKMKAFL